MIHLKKISGKEVVINAELIESIESSPDTVITLVTGNRYIVQENPEAIVEKVLEFKRKVYESKGHVVPDWASYKKT